MNILSIQSHVVYGHAGNASAVFPMQRLGAEVWPIHTVQFSNDTGYGDWQGQVFDSGAIDALLAGLDARDALVRCDAVLSGYLGAGDTGRAVARAVARVKSHNPDAIYCCDPVIGDVGVGVYVANDIPDLLHRELIPLADIVTPNHFELGHLAGMPTSSLNDVKRAISAVASQGPRVVLVTSVRTDETPLDCLDLIIGEGGRFHRVRTPRFDINMSGAGDVIAALFLVHYLRSRSAVTALQAAAAATFGLLRITASAGSRELLLIAAQEEFVSPTTVFDVVPI